MVIKTKKKQTKKTLKFYILRRKDERCDFDEMCRCIVYATHPKQARSIAQQACLDECHDDRHNEYAYWTDPRKTTCQLLLSVYKHESKPQMVLDKTLDA
jgi:hypothetical protein